MIFSKKCDIIPLGKSHKSLEMQKNLVQNSGTRWYFSCTVYIFSADDIFRKVAENPEKSTILANILRYLQIYIPAGPHWGGRGRTFKLRKAERFAFCYIRPNKADGQELIGFLIYWLFLLSTLKNSISLQLCFEPGHLWK